VRLWDVKTRALLVSLFRGSDGEWVIWTPEGFFAGSEKGAERVGWQINQGPGKEARYVSGAQLRATFLRPDLVAKKLACAAEGEEAEKACAGYREQAARYSLERVLASGPAPETAIVSPAKDAQAAGTRVTVKARILDKGGGIGRIAWRVNGQEVHSARGALMLDAQHEISHDFDLASVKNVIEVTAENAAGLVTSQAVGLTVSVDERDLKDVPDLYVLAIGVDEYKNMQGVLHYAVADGQAIGDALVEAGKDYYRHKPAFMFLKNEEVTAAKIEAALKELAPRVKATDVFVFFAAGHGKTIDGDYYFAPRSIDHLTEKAIKAEGFGPAQWRAWFELIQAQKSIWILDTCDAGSAEAMFRTRGIEDDTAYIRLKSATGRTLFMASGGEQQANEGFRDHGLLTYSFLEGLALAGNQANKLVDLADLKTFVEIKVPEYSRSLPSCRAARGDQFCQMARVAIPGATFPLVPRYPAILAKLGAGGPAISQKPTHVVTAAAELFETASRGGPAKRQLKRFELVTLIKAGNGWAYIAKEGKPLGYVEEDKLAPIAE
jgi:hypothetical protein